MNIENRFLAIKSFLLEHFELLSSEVLENADNLPSEYLNWAKSFAKLEPQLQIDIENGVDTNSSDSVELNHYLSKIKELSKLPTQEYKESNIPKKLQRKLTLKKQHEITQIQGVLKSLEHKNFVDIGSGAGHLSSVLLYENDKRSICIDRDKQFQNIGKEKLKKSAPDIIKRLTFETKEIGPNFDLDAYSADMLIGLHTCGDLSPDLINAYIKSGTKAFMNIGCCYHKLSDDHYNLSKLSQEGQTLKLTNHALTMAAKSYKTMTTQERMTRLSVKSYRYTLHLFMQEVLNIPFKSLGNANAQDYLGPFESYAFKYLPELKTTRPEKLKQFYLEKQGKVRDLIDLGIIRGLLARVVETYIILDRAILLKEHGHTVKVKDLFDRTISPRNLAIIVKSGT